MFDWVYDNLYVGDFDALKRQAMVKEEGIKAIVRLDVAGQDKYKWGDDFTVCYMPFADTMSIPSGIIPKVTAFIHEQVEQDKPVLVHCAAGVSRSTTLTMAYLIEYEGMSLAEAFGTVREGRTQAYPHENLLISLIEHYDLPYDTSRVVNPRFISELLTDV
ncbi:MAG: dual specificity protein phosphatase [Chloroflexota bacterium]